MVTIAEWRQRLLDDLGADGLDIEITTRQTDTALRRAIQMWNRWRPNLRWLSLGDVGAAGTVMFQLDKDEVGVAGVLHVEFADMDYPTVTPLASTRVVLWGRRGPRIFFQTLVSERRMERFTGTQPDWFWEPNDRILYLYVPSRPVRVMALFTKPRVIGGENLGEETLEDVRYDEEHLFEETALAFLKVIAANILQQAGDVPGPHGAAIGSNAEKWRTEGTERLAEIEKELKTSLRATMPPSWVG